jgi:four helix bundle protein
VRRKGDDIAERLLDLGVGVLRLTPLLCDRPGAFAVARQLERCGPAGGALYEEARGAESPADFVHKIRVCLKEVRETHYWLRLSVRAGLLAPCDCGQRDDHDHALGDRPQTQSPGPAARLIDESGQLVAILTACAKTARERQRNLESKR